MKKFLFFFTILICVPVAKSQLVSDTVIFNSESAYWYTPSFYTAYSCQFDKRANQPYIYAASNEAGLIVFDYSNPNNLVPTDTLPPSMFGMLRPMNVFQNGNFLYVPLGGYIGIFPQRAGLAILDANDPENLTLTDMWDSTVYSQGAAVAISDGNFAYLGAMEEGVIILDVNNKNNIVFKSNILPDPNFPEVPGLFSTPNARGMVLRNDTLLLCYDAGALRMIDVVNKTAPFEISKYINQTMYYYSSQVAYNNIVLVGDIAYIATDYCGIDVVDVSDSSMQTLNWIHPWPCDSTQWTGSPGHTNQLTVVGDSLLFVSGGDTEALVFDITDPVNPVLVGNYNHQDDSLVTWSIDANASYAALGYIYSPLIDTTIAPYIALQGGVELLSWQAIVTGIREQKGNSISLSCFPNPSSDRFMLRYNAEANTDSDIEIYSVTGQLVYSKNKYRNRQGINFIELDLSGEPDGIYLVHLTSDKSSGTLRIIHH